MRGHHHIRFGFSLIELLIVITIVGIMAAMLVPNANTSIGDQLESSAHVLAADLDYARNLAVVYNSTYRVTFDTTGNTWTLTNSGSDPTLSVLPASPLHSPLDPPTSQTTRLGSLPGISDPAAIYTLYAQASPLLPVTNVEFGPLGSTTQAATTVIWLVAGGGAATHYVSVSVNPVTGLATMGNFQMTPPATPAITGSTTTTTH